MSLLPPPLAELGSIEKFIITALAVAGGFLVGFVLTHFVSRLLSKFVWRKEPPEKLLRLTRFAGGVAAAILVYLLLSGDGGLGLGGKGGGGEKKDKGDQKAEQPAQLQDSRQDPKVDSKKFDKKDDLPAGKITIYTLPSTMPGVISYRIEGQDHDVAIEHVLKWIAQRNMEKKIITQVRIDFMRKDGIPVPNSPSDGRLLLRDKLEQQDPDIEVILPSIKPK